jgi:hypothetical protein
MGQMVSGGRIVLSGLENIFNPAKYIPSSLKIPGLFPSAQCDFILVS